MHVHSLSAQAPGGEIAQAAAGIEDQFAARCDQPDLAFGIRIWRHARRGEHLYAIDFKGWWPPGRGYQLDQRAGEARHWLKAGVAVGASGEPVVNRSILAAGKVWEQTAIPEPSVGTQLDRGGGTIQIQRAAERGRVRAASGQQCLVYLQGQQRPGGCAPSESSYRSDSIRHWPFASSPSNSGPSATRTTRSTAMSKAASSRLICRLRPSSSTISSHACLCPARRQRADLAARCSPSSSTPCSSCRSSRVDGRRSICTW